MAEDDTEWSHDEKSKLDALWTALLNAKFELGRRILTISSAGIGLIVTVGANLNTSSELIGSSLIGSLTAFVFAVGATIRSLYVDSPYLERAIYELRTEETSDRLKALSRRTEQWEKAGLAFFGSGVLILLVAGITTIIFKIHG